MVAGVRPAAAQDRTGVTVNSVKVGVLGSLTGVQAVFGQGNISGAEIVFDEVNAAGGIDGRRIEEIFRKLIDIRARATGILLVAQNAAVALEVADRGYVMETGQIRLEGTAADLAAGDAVRETYLR